MKRHRMEAGPSEAAPARLTSQQFLPNGTATILTGIVSVIALLMSGLSLYETVLKQARLRLYVPDTIAYTRDPNGSYEVIVVPITLANNGARDGVIAALQLNVRNSDTGIEREFSASFVASEGYFSTKEDYSQGKSRPKKAFAPVSVAGRSAYTGTLLFYPRDYSEERVIPGEGTYNFRLSARMIAHDNSAFLDRLWSNTIVPVNFSAKLPPVGRFFNGQMLTGRSVRMFVDRTVPTTTVVGWSH